MEGKGGHLGGSGQSQGPRPGMPLLPSPAEITQEFTNSAHFHLGGESVNTTSLLLSSRRFPSSAGWLWRGKNRTPVANSWKGRAAGPWPGGRPASMFLNGRRIGLVRRPIFGLYLD